MPDEGWYQLNAPQKEVVFDDYIEDVKEFPDLYEKCHRSYFDSIWLKNYPDIKLRKYCRFAKCEFCVDWRRIFDNFPDRRAEASLRLKHHREWANVQERAYWKQKQDLASTEPEKYISLSIDGTDKFPRGFPHFWEHSKGEKGMGLKLHTDIVCVHGASKGSYIYVADESIHSDPNLTVEVLYQSLRHEQEKRKGALPATLYLQLDNCIRENKNTVFMSYLAWLVERGVFRHIFLSFLPVGHTHFDCDALASRISTALKHVDHYTLDHYQATLELCTTPRPTVALLKDVADMACLLNPTRNSNFPVGSARCIRQLGCCTKVVSPGREDYMSPTSPLHFRFELDIAGDVYSQSKLTCQDDLWSKQSYPFETKAPRPNNRVTAERKSGLLPSDLKIAPRRPLALARSAELRRSLDKSVTKIPAAAAEHIEGIWENVSRAPAITRPAPYMNGWFTGESHDAVQNSGRICHDNGNMELRANARIFSGPGEAGRARQHRRDGVVAEQLCIGSFVATECSYKDDVPENERQDFWLGKIVELDSSDNTVRVEWYNTSTKRNLAAAESGPGATNNAARYRLYGGETTDKVGWIHLKDVLETFSNLTDKGYIHMATLRKIKNTVVLRASEAISN
jgi:hypothetical protein